MVLAPLSLDDEEEEEELELELEPLPPSLVPSGRVPVPCGLGSAPLQVYSPLMTPLLPASPSTLSQASLMSREDWRLNAPLTSESSGRETLRIVSNLLQMSIVRLNTHVVKLP